MSGRSVSVYTDMSASHKYLCTLIENRHELCKLLIIRPQTTDLIVDWIELSHLSKVKPNLTCVLLLPGPQKRKINMAVVLSMWFGFY